MFVKDDKYDLVKYYTLMVQPNYGFKLYKALQNN